MINRPVLLALGDRGHKNDYLYFATINTCFDSCLTVVNVLECISAMFSLKRIPQFVGALIEGSKHLAAGRLKISQIPDCLFWLGLDAKLKLAKKLKCRPISIWVQPTDSVDLAIYVEEQQRGIEIFQSARQRGDPVDFMSSDWT